MSVSATKPAPAKATPVSPATPATPVSTATLENHKDGSKDYSIQCVNGDHARCIAARKTAEARQAREDAKAKAAIERANRPVRVPKEKKEVVLDSIKRDGKQVVVFANPAMPLFSWQLAGYPVWSAQLWKNDVFVDYHQMPTTGAHKPVELALTPSSDYDTIILRAGKVTRTFVVANAK